MQSREHGMTSNQNGKHQASPSHKDGDAAMNVEVEVEMELPSLPPPSNPPLRSSRSHVTNNTNHAISAKLQAKMYFVILGIGFLLPWNAFLGVASYFASRLCQSDTTTTSSDATRSGWETWVAENLEAVLAFVYNASAIGMLCLLTCWFSCCADAGESVGKRKCKCRFEWLGKWWWRGWKKWCQFALLDFKHKSFHFNSKTQFQNQQQQQPQEEEEKSMPLLPQEWIQHESRDSFLVPHHDHDHDNHSCHQNPTSIKHSSTKDTLMVILPLALYLLCFLLTALLTLFPSNQTFPTTRQFLILTLLTLVMCGSCSAVVSTGILAFASRFYQIRPQRPQEGDREEEDENDGEDDSGEGKPEEGVQGFVMGQGLAGVLVSLGNVLRVLLAYDAGTVVHQALDQQPEYEPQPEQCQPYTKVDWMAFGYFVAGALAVVGALMAFACLLRLHAQTPSVEGVVSRMQVKQEEDKAAVQGEATEAWVHHDHFEWQQQESKDRQEQQQQQLLLPLDADEHASRKDKPTHDLPLLPQHDQSRHDESAYNLLPPITTTTTELDSHEENQNHNREQSKIHSSTTPPPPLLTSTLVYNLLTCFLTLFVTLSFFPAWTFEIVSVHSTPTTTQTPPPHANGAIASVLTASVQTTTHTMYQELFFPILFLLFNVFDVLGRMAAEVVFPYWSGSESEGRARHEEDATTSTTTTTVAGGGASQGGGGGMSRSRWEWSNKSWYQRHFAPLLSFLTLLRGGLFYPLLFACRHHRHSPPTTTTGTTAASSITTVGIQSDLYAMTTMSLFAFSNGLGLSLALMHASSSHATPTPTGGHGMMQGEEKERRGRLVSTLLTFACSLGLFGGSLFSFVVVWVGTGQW